MQDVLSNEKNNYNITEWDKSVIIAVQNSLADIPIEIPRFISTYMYIFMLIIPFLVGAVYFFRKYLLIDIILLGSTVFISYGFNYIFKKIVNRPRPPMELQFGHHSNSQSYVSNHTLITFCLWGLTAYYINLYCKNKFLKLLGILIAVIWVLLEGFSRIWLGVHNPTDVIGGYFLGTIFVLIYINMAKLVGGKA